MNFLREIVSGPKNRIKEDGYNLDLTYVCPRVIAMSYPASGVESVYRNPIDKVLDFQWEDHHSPPIHTLFQICQKMQIFLKAKKENVCIIHCLAGKGRTGTIICCFLVYSGIIETTEDALNYYSKKRFIQEGFGVNQPCQIRYLQYFHEILKSREGNAIFPKLVYIKKVVFQGRPNFNTQKGCRPYFDIVYVRTKQQIFSTKKAYADAPKFLDGDTFEYEFSQQVGLCGDLLIRIKHNGYYKNQKIARISLNTSFVPDDTSKVLKFTLEELSPSSLIKDSRFPKNFVIEIHFGQFCNCTRLTAFKDKCKICGPQIQKEKEYWEIMLRILKNYHQLDRQEQRNMLFGNPSTDDIQLVLQNKAADKSFQSNTFKFDSQQDKFIQEIDIQKKEGKDGYDAEEIKENHSPVKQLEQDQQKLINNDDEAVSPIKIRKRSDVRHNFYSEDQAFSSKKIQTNQIRINTNSTITNNKENLNTSINTKQLNNIQGLSYNPNEVVFEHNDGNDEDNNELDYDEINDIPEEPPSPLSPKNSYANKVDNDTDIDSPYEDSHPNQPKCSQHFSQFKGKKQQNQNLLVFDKDSFDDLHNDSDDPAPQKPFQGDKIFVNNMKHQ